MRYHNITHDDMLNGDGIRVVLWVSGCEHHCRDCQNPITWNPDDGKEFSVEEFEEIATELSKPYVAGITFSGGDPLHPNNISSIQNLIQAVSACFPDKTIWLYTGYTWDEIMQQEVLKALVSQVDVLVDGKFEPDLKDKNYHWAGSTNQKVIDAKESLKKGRMILHESYQEGWNSGRIQFRKDCQCS